MNTKVFILLVSILVAVAIIANMPVKFDPSKEAQMAQIPKEIGEWKGTDVPLSEHDYQILETKNLVMREYKNDTGDLVYLYIIYSADNRRALHPPEVCYSGGGGTIVQKSVIPLTDDFKVNKFLVERKGVKHLVVYWFRSTTLNTYSYLKQQSKTVFDRLLGRKTSGSMIRVSADFKQGKEEATLELIKDFYAQLMPLLDKYVP